MRIMLLGFRGGEPSSQNSPSRDCLENSQRVLNCLWLVAQEGEMGHFVLFWPLANTPDREAYSNFQTVSLGTSVNRPPAGVPKSARWHHGHSVDPLDKNAS